VLGLEWEWTFAFALSAGTATGTDGGRTGRTERRRAAAGGVRAGAEPMRRGRQAAANRGLVCK
jgi:hypothetical protein